MAYLPPQLPALAAVWHAADKIPPDSEPNAVIDVSISPVRPEDFLRATDQQGALPVTHIIRCNVHPDIGENFVPGAPVPLLPATLFEAPPASGHYYIAIWAHIVGWGFPNQHQRVYCTRYANTQFAELPFFRGWI